MRHAGPSLITRLVLLELAAAVLPLAVIGVIGVLVGRVTAGAAIAGPLAGLSLLLFLQQAIGPPRASGRRWRWPER